MWVRISDKLYFEPVFWEHIYDIIQHEKPEGVIVQLGGQTALKLAEKLSRYGVKIIGTSYEALDLAEDRGSFSTLLKNNKERKRTKKSSDKPSQIQINFFYEMYILTSYRRGLKMIGFLLLII